MNALTVLRNAKKEDPYAYAEAVNRVFNDVIIRLRKEQERNRRLKAAIAKLVNRSPPTQQPLFSEPA